MKTSLLKVTWKKEKRHWKRTYDTTKNVKNWFGKIFIGLVLLTIGNLVHYAFSFMSTLWQSLLFLVARDRFRLNLQRQELKLI